MNKKPFELAFVTVNYNGKSDTIALLDSIFRSDLSIDYTVVVIDNGSVQNEWNYIRDIYPDIYGVRSEENLGFAGGNNLGLGIVEADFFFFINNDTLLPDDADNQIKGMLDFLKRNPTAGGLSPKIKYYDNPEMIQFAGSTELSKITLRNKQIGYQELDKGQYQEIKEIPYLHGAAMLIPSAVIKEMGLMPELYFLYYEELDWSATIRKKYLLYYYPKAYILHKESASTGVNSPFKTYYLFRNRLIYAFRNRSGINRIAAMLYLVLIAVYHVLRQVVEGRFDNSKAIIRGTIAAFVWMLDYRKK